MFFDSCISFHHHQVERTSRIRLMCPVHPFRSDIATAMCSMRSIFHLLFILNKATHFKPFRMENQNTQQPSLCRAGCGFYGNSSFDGMCSKCFKDALRRTQSTSPTGCISPATNISGRYSTRCDFRIS
jgi:hypothetical protein